MYKLNYIFKNFLSFFSALFTLITKSRKIEHIFFVPFFHTGGAEKVHLEIVKSLESYKSIVFFVYPSKDTSFYHDFKNCAYLIEVPDGIHAYQFFKNIYLNILLFFFKGSKSIKTIFGCNNHLFYEVIENLGSTNIKKIDLLHAFSYPDNGIENYSVGFVDKINTRVVINERTKNDYIQQYRQNNIDSKYIQNITVIPNAINIPPEYDKNPNEKLNILYAGRTTHEKRPHLYTSVAAKLKGKFNFSLAGGPKENIDLSNITYLGNLNEKELQETYKHTDILVLTSYREGFPMVIMEAMANGVVCISTDVGNIAEHLKNNFNGFVISEKEESVIADKIVEKINYLNENREALMAMSKNGADYAKLHFNMENFREKYRDVFK